MKTGWKNIYVDLVIIAQGDDHEFLCLFRIPMDEHTGVIADSLCSYNSKIYLKHDLINIIQLLQNVMIIKT